MSKKVAKVCKLQFPAGGARPGPALASAGINMPQLMMLRKNVPVMSFQLSLLHTKTRALTS